MRLARVDVDARPRIVVRDGDAVRIAPADLPDDPLHVLEVARTHGTADWQPLDLDERRLLAPVATAGKIVAVGLNYADHTSETGFAQPERPLTFAKYPSSIAGPLDDVVVPDHLTTQVDYEVELALVIGRRCGGATQATLDDVAAVTVANDVSARDVQFADTQWTRAKSFDTFTPLGPWLVTPDELALDDLRITLDVDGETLQDDRTSSLIFDLPTLLAFIGDGTTLEPGDLILTGTPAGAGGFRTPPRFVQHGETMTATIEGIGALRNRVVHRSRIAEEAAA